MDNNWIGFVIDQSGNDIMTYPLSICTTKVAEKGFAMTKFLIKIISLGSFDMTVANHAYFAAMFGYT